MGCRDPYGQDDVSVGDLANNRTQSCIANIEKYPEVCILERNEVIFEWKGHIRDQ